MIGKHVHWIVLEQITVVLSLKTGQFSELSGRAAELWQNLQEGSLQTHSEDDQVILQAFREMGLLEADEPIGK
jgi:protein involved in temperature-dependent protein secretion